MAVIHRRTSDVTRPAAANAVGSCRREAMSSFRNTLLKWYSTVEVVTNSWVAISTLVAPAAASRET